MKMPFGKHRGAPLDSLPDEYLLWLGELDDLREPLRSAVYDEIGARSGSSGSATALKLAAADVPLAREIVQAGRRAAALRHHPDKGGDSRHMVAINATADKLLAALGASR